MVNKYRKNVKKFFLIFFNKKFHSVRTTYAYCKYHMYLENKEVFNKDFFKIVDLVFMFFYAIGFLMLGSLGDRYHLRYYLAFAGFIVFASVAG